MEVLMRVPFKSFTCAGMLAGVLCAAPCAVASANEQIALLNIQKLKAHGLIHQIACSESQTAACQEKVRACYKYCPEFSDYKDRANCYRLCAYDAINCYRACR